jgi:cytochrome c biogenesis protein CcmG, thiol:disulfide interchange protein DsbE
LADLFYLFLVPNLKTSKQCLKKPVNCAFLAPISLKGCFTLSSFFFDMKNIFILLLVCCFASNAMTQTSTEKNEMRMRISTARQQNQIDSIFPFDISLRTLDSALVNSQDVFKKNGQATVVAFWLTTCFPCLIELEAYTKEYESWQKTTPFNLIAISTDFPEKFDRIGEIATEKKFPFSTYWDFNREFKEILPGGLNGLPQVFLFDKNGKLVWQHKRFYSGDEKELFAKVREYSN